MVDRMKKLELENERRRRIERKRNIILKGVKIEKEGMEGLKEEAGKIVRATGTDAKIEEIRKLG